MGTAIGNAFKQMGDNLTNGSSGQGPSKTGLCPDCGRQVSKLASTCPHCGRPLDASVIEQNPAEKPWYNRTAADNEKIRNAERSSGSQRSSAGIVVAVVIGIIIAVFILSQVVQINVTGTITPMK